MTDEEQAELDKIVALLGAAIPKLERLSASHDQLLAALREAAELIRTWHRHGMNIPEGGELAIWEAYQASPEMVRINAAIAAAEELAP